MKFFLALSLLTSAMALATPTKRDDNQLKTFLTSFKEDKGGRFELTDGNALKRVSGSGSVEATIQLTDAEVAQVKAFAGQTSKPRDENVFDKRFGCIAGTWCHDDSTCYFAGCDGCMYLPTGGGVCYGTTY
ncbi:hypothetical protein BJ170DRAFT_687895 [Xylariales sp. AK1849]|nr:hypothetical protein BJ170DRAFT_687895 [Xylariales sp. AK1849]